MSMYENKGKYLTYLLRHHPEDCHLYMDKKGMLKLNNFLIMLMNTVSIH